MTDKGNRDVDYERGPNGFPYVDINDSTVSAWENGEFHLKIWREDGEMLRVNLTPEQLSAIADGANDTLDKAAEKAEVDFDGSN